jgi:hypothetical protein
MRYVEYISNNWKYWKLNISHSVFVNWDYVLSYEMKKPFWCWRFYIYSIDEWKYFVKKITYEEYVEDEDLLQREWIEFNWYTCFEALNMIKSIKRNRVIDYINILIFFTIWVAIWYTVWFRFYYTNTISEEQAKNELQQEILKHKEQICLN